VSPSQIADFELCPRRWFNHSRLGIKRPQSAAAARGQSVHAPLEAGLKTGAHGLPSGDERTIHVEAALVELPRAHFLRDGAARPASKPLLVEHKPAHCFVVEPGQLTTSGVALDCRIDLFDLDLSPDGFASIGDHKTTSDFRYCKTPDELRVDVQLLTYAWWALFTDEGRALLAAAGARTDGIRIYHTYIDQAFRISLTIS
jgi:hypothetical protein